MNLDKSSQGARTAPVWYVTNGESIVGPIPTGLLLRGITSARIPEDCRVTQESWTSWRTLDEIREASLVGRVPAWFDGAYELEPAGGVSDELVRRASDAGEALLLALHAAVAATRATGGLVHRLREPFVGWVTSSARGAMAEQNLGEIIPRHDAALAAARDGRTILGCPSGGEAERAIARRFSDHGYDIAAVAMVPVFDGGTLLAMLELARADHPFRARDEESLQRIAQVVCLK